MHPKTLSIKTHHLVLMANVKDAPFKCPTCKKVFISETYLKRHEDRRHNSKVISIPSVPVKDSTVYETTDEPTMKAVLNATERIEDLLVKLAVKENEKKPITFGSSKSNFDDSLITSSSTTTKTNEEDIENCNHISNSSTPKKMPTDIIELICHTSNLKDDPVTSNSFTKEKNEQNIENREYVFNDSASAKKYKDMAKLKYNAGFTFNNTPIPLNSYFEKNELSNENSKNISNDIESNKNRIEVADLKPNDMTNFEDTLVTSNFSATDKNEQNIVNCENISHESASSKKRKEIAEFKLNERSDFEDTRVDSVSYTLENSEPNIESSERISFQNFPLKKSKGITKMTFSDLLEEEENKAIWRITSSIIKSSNFSLEVLDPIYTKNDGGIGKKELINPHCDSFHEERPMKKCHSSVKSEILRKLNRKLELYGINCSQSKLSDRDVTRIGHLLKEERDSIAEEVPDYHKLRQLIKDNAHRRIEENLRVHSTYVS